MTRFAACFLLVTSIGVASADDDPRELSPAAKQRSDAGVEAYKASAFDTASREFEAAYAIDPDPALLYMWAQALRKGGRCDDAVPMYRRYLETELTQTQIEAANSGISLCETPATPPPPPPPPPVEDPQPVPPVAQHDRPAWYTDKLGGTLAIGGVIATGVGVGFLVMAKRREDRARDAEFRDDFEVLLDEANSRLRIGLVGVGVGAALVAGAIVRYATRGDEPRSVTVATTGTSLLVIGRF